LEVEATPVRAWPDVEQHRRSAEGRGLHPPGRDAHLHASLHRSNRSRHAHPSRQTLHRFVQRLCLALVGEAGLDVMQPARIG
jgi:hypothetical protein